jgi:hypothetical protein
MTNRDAGEPAGHELSAGEGARGVKPAVALRNAREQLAALLGREPESVSALARNEEGWTADVEVLEMERIPDSTSVLATYTVQLDRDGDLLGYERRRRYTRGQVDRG